MTALCGGGTSGPQGGVAGVLTLGAAAIEVFISGLGLPEIAPIVAPIIAALVDIDIVSYCSTDPPADPGLGAGDIADAISIPPSLTTFSSQQKILTWFEARYWYQICQCVSTTTPAPSAPSNPGAVATDPGLPVQPTPCWNVTVPYTVIHPVSPVTLNTVDETPFALPIGFQTPVNIQTSPVVVGQSVPMPAGATHLSMTATINEAVVGTAGQNVLISYQGYNSSGGLSPGDAMAIQFTHLSTTTTSTRTQATIPVTSTHAAVFVSQTDSVDHSGSIAFSFFCAPGTPTPTQCCPPDPLLEGELQQILQYVQAIYAGLPIPPNSFAEGTVHSGLTGNGSVTFADLPIAIKVTLTTIPSWVGFEVGAPNFYFDVGYLTFATSEGSYAQERIELQDQVVAVPLLAGSVGYTLKQGVVASITELTAGP